MSNKVFTPDQVAKICKVARRTVCKWFESGRIKGYRTTDGKGEPRIPREFLIKFLKEHGMPIPDELRDGLIKVVIVAREQSLITGLQEGLSPDNGYKVAVTANALECGIQVERMQPDAIILDIEYHKVEAKGILQSVYENPDHSDIVMVALMPHHPISLDSSKVEAVFTRPFDINDVAERVRELVKKELP
jgi:excisionase family DNA binding protein